MYVRVCVCALIVVMGGVVFALRVCLGMCHDCVPWLQSWEALVRIVTSPTPFLYRHLLATLVFIFVFAFPFGFVETLGVVVIPAAGVMCFGLYGVLELAQELENPLGWDLNDIDLTGFQVGAGPRAPPPPTCLCCCVSALPQEPRWLCCCRRRGGAWSVRA